MEPTLIKSFSVVEMNRLECEKTTGASSRLCENQITDHFGMNAWSIYVYPNRHNIIQTHINVLWD